MFNSSVLGRGSIRACLPALMPFIVLATLYPQVSADDPNPLWAVEGRWVDPPCPPGHPSGENCSDWSGFPHQSGLRVEDAFLLPDGNVFLRWRETFKQYVWNPTTGTFTLKDHAVFCTNLPDEECKTAGCPGLVAMADGRVMVAGGTDSNCCGNEPDGCEPGQNPWADWVAVYNFKIGKWTQLPGLPSYTPTTHGSWYPTLTALPDGRILATGGKTGCGGAGSSPPMDPSIFDPANPTEWIKWTGEKTLHHQYPTNGISGHVNYPRVFVLPEDDRLFLYHSPREETYLLDLENETWSDPLDAPSWISHKDSAVMYRPGKVLRSGGKAGGEVFQHTAMIDLSGSNPEQAQWQPLPQMIHPREAHDLIVLPTGHVIAVGGNEDDDDSAPVLHAEWIDPDDPIGFGGWQQLAESIYPRIYHSVALLLPDGRVLAAGGNGIPCNPPACCDTDPQCDPCCEDHCQTPQCSPECCDWTKQERGIVRAAVFVLGGASRDPTGAGTTPL